MNQRMKQAIRTVLLGISTLAITLTVVAPADAKTAVKIATLAPDGSVWEKTLRTMGDRWRRETDGEVTMRLYPGGVAGDEPDIVRKMNIGQLHGATLTTTGLAAIDSAFDVFQLPLFFASYDELFAVLETLRPTLESRLEAKGYVLLSWGHGGWIHLFSTAPVRQVSDLEKLKIFAWSGDETMIARWRRNGFQPVPLAATDIMTGLTTGMIDALPTTPLAALSLQWFRHTPHMQDLGVGPLVGATVLHRRIWDRLSDSEKAVLRAAAREAEDTLRVEVPEQDARAVAAMESRGLTVTEIDAETRAPWESLAERFTADMSTTIRDKTMLEALRRARAAYRAANAEAETSGAADDGR